MRPVQLQASAFQDSHHRRKHQWAGMHLDRLERQCAQFVDSKPYLGVATYDEVEQCMVARIRVQRELPDDLGLIVGDVVHAMRSSLDAITYALAVRHSGPAAAAGSTSLQFPIADKAESFQRSRLSLLSAEAQAAIESMQPFQRQVPGETHALSIVRELSNHDKHRRIALVAARTDYATVSVESDALEADAIVGGYAGPLEEGTVIARWTIEGAEPADGFDMRLRGSLPFNLIFAGHVPAAVQDIRHDLRTIQQWIGEYLFPKLEGFVGP